MLTGKLNLSKCISIILLSTQTIIPGMEQIGWNSARKYRNIFNYVCYTLASASLPRAFREKI